MISLKSNRPAAIDLKPVAAERDPEIPDSDQPLPLDQDAQRARSLGDALAATLVAHKRNIVKLAEGALRAARQKRIEASERLAGAINSRRAAAEGLPGDATLAALRQAQAEVDAADQAVRDARDELARRRTEWQPQVTARNAAHLAELQRLALHHAEILHEALAQLHTYGRALTADGLIVPVRVTRAAFALESVRVIVNQIRD